MTDAFSSIKRGLEEAMEEIMKRKLYICSGAARCGNGVCCHSKPHIPKYSYGLDIYCDWATECRVSEDTVRCEPVRKADKLEGEK